MGRHQGGHAWRGRHRVNPEFPGSCLCSAVSPKPSVEPVLPGPPHELGSLRPTAVCQRALGGRRGHEGVAPALLGLRLGLPQVRASGVADADSYTCNRNEEELPQTPVYE